MRNEIKASDFMGGGVGQAKRHLDGCNFRFYPWYKDNKEQTEKVGYAQHDPCEFIEIINFAGDRTCRPVEERDKRAYPEQYARFIERETKPETGLYLREWCTITPAALADIEAFGLRTVEQLADLTEDTLAKYKFLIEWHRKANNWLKNAKSKQAECANLAEKLHKLNEKYVSLEGQYYNALRRIEANEGNRFNA